MRKWKTILTMLCAGLWLAATTHCGWERFPGLSQFACDDASAKHVPSPASHCADDFCQLVESGHYLPARSAPDELTPPVADLAAVLAFVQPALDQPPALQGNRPATDSPPELPKTWQFDSRAAFSVRAPSLAS